MRGSKGVKYKYNTNIVLDYKSGKARELEEGERIIEAFFVDNGIESRSQVYMFGLKRDVYYVMDDKGQEWEILRPYRIPDFYLPRYKMFVEFKGKHKDYLVNGTYKEKEKIYSYPENSIPCILLYPDNLGTLNYIFHFRMLQVLRGGHDGSKVINGSKRKMKYELFKYRFDRVYKKMWEAVFMIIALGLVYKMADTMYYEHGPNDYLDIARSVAAILLGLVSLAWVRFIYIGLFTNEYE